MTPISSPDIAKRTAQTHGYVIGCLHALIRTGSIVAGEYRYSGAYYDGRELHPIYILKPRAASVLLSCVNGKDQGPVHQSGRGLRAKRPTAQGAKRSTSRRASMKELIPVQQSEVSGKQVKTVNARDLHAFLESKQFAKAVYERFKIGRNRLYAILRDLKVLRFNNEPYQEYMERGWFKQVEKTYINPKTEQVVPYFLTLITGKGQVGIFKLLDAHLGREVANA